MKLTEIPGDLFSAPSDFVFAHCISSDSAMGAGIAAAFTQRYPKLRSNLKSRAPFVGQALFYEGEDGRGFFNLITKRNVRDKPTCESLRKTLLAMRNQLEQAGLGKLAMPRIGCGIDRLEWDKVRPIIEEVFAETDLEIVVYVLP